MDSEIDNEICEIVISQKGYNKINVRGYLMVKEKDQNDVYYWCCEKRKGENCKGRAVTKFSNGSHYLQKFVDHNHSPQATDGNVANAVAHIKQQAKETKEPPVQIIQSNITNISEEVATHMPTQNALRARIKRVRKAETLPEPQSLDGIDIQDSLQFTLSGDPFLIRDSTIREKRILLFTTKGNIRHLSQASFWIMDGTFQTVPTIFYQLYTIHAPVGADDNYRILPLVYALMSSKTEDLYRALFQYLNEFSEEIDIELRPSTIITDFERASINASCGEYPDITNKGCFFHLSQNGWRKIQKAGLATQYGSDENLSIMLRHLFALAFLPADDIPDAFDILKPLIPSIADSVVSWFEENYVHGKIQRRLRNNNVVRLQPTFPPKLWSVHDSIESGIPRTQNVVEAWHHRWKILVGKPHVGVYTIIQEFQKEQHQVEVQIEKILRGEQRPSQKKSLIEREKRIMTIFNDRANRELMDYLRGIAHNISL